MCRISLAFDQHKLRRKKGAARAAGEVLSLGHFNTGTGDRCNQRKSPEKRKHHDTEEHY
jgi:hypothetical protein